LQQALGDDHADDLLRAIETTKQQAKDAAVNAVHQKELADANAARQNANVRLRRIIAGSAAGAALGSIPGYELLRHLLGEKRYDSRRIRP
jgi:hypothetical protein